MSVATEDISNAVRDLGLSGQPICVHSSLRSFGHVEGGPRAVIQGLLAEGCTVLVPTFTPFRIPPPPGVRIPHNAYDYDNPPPDTTGGRIYTPECNDIEGYMGAIPAALLEVEGRVRGNHPVSPFAAAGPLAHELISGQAPLRWLAPLEKLCEMNGWIIMMGVGLTSMTLIHLAEKEVGRNQFIRWARVPGGKIIEVQVGSCSAGFGKFDPIFAQFERRVMVGESLWRVFPAKETLEAAKNAIRMDPTITHCGDPNCERCRDAALGGPIWPHSDGRPKETE